MGVASIELDSLKTLDEAGHNDDLLSIVILDHKGTTLFNSTHSELNGLQESEYIFRRMVEGPKEGKLEIGKGTNDAKIASYRKLQLPGEAVPYMYVQVALYNDVIMEAPNKRLIVNIFILMVGTAIALYFAFRISERYLLNKVFENERDFQYFIENSNSLIYTLSADGLITYAAPTVETLLGYLPSELIGKSFEPLVHSDDLLACKRFLRDVFDTKMQRSGLEYRIRHKNGNWLWHMSSASLIAASITGKSVFLGVGININERKLAEKELINNEKRMASLFEISQYPFTNDKEFLDHALAEVIRLTESKIGYIYFYSEENRQFTLNTWSNEVMKECSITESQTIYHLDKTGIWGEAVRQRKPILLNDFQAHHPLKKGVPEGHVLLKRFLTVPVFINETIVAVVGVANKESDYNDSDIMQLALFMDAVWKITENKRITEEKLVLERQLLHAQKLESLGIMAGGIAHDFNNLLQSILGNIELVGMRLDSDSKSKEYIKQAKMAGKKAAHLSSLMLTYAGNRFTDKRALNLNKLAAENTDIFQSATTAAVTIEMNLAEELPAIIADEAQLQQVVMNLITNAAESIVQQAGLIRITTGIHECDQSDMVGNLIGNKLQSGRYVFIDVSDNGCGMNNETISRLFDPFFTTKFTGRGLGMSAVMGIMKSHDGGLFVQSEIGKGTTFKAIFPATESEANTTVPDTEAAEQPAPQGEPLTGMALIVDDDKSVLRNCATMVRLIGLKVITARDGIDAISKFQQQADAIDVVILDLTMPIMDGVTAMEEIYNIRQDAKILLASGFNKEELDKRITSQPPSGFIRKPYSMNELEAGIRKVMDRA